jgi:sigma-B regulation protein RsbU (phosphoserine phosphatase)
MCPSQVLATLNRRLMIRGTARRHAAVQYAVFDPQTQVMKIAGGGMPGSFHLSPSGCCRALEVQGIPPGLFDPSVSYETLDLPLEPGDSVLFFTDGLPDALTPTTRASVWSGCRRIARHNRSAPRRTFWAKYFQR